MINKNLNIPNLIDFKINGVIHIGAGTGEYCKQYYDLGIHQVLWIEQYKELYSQLYKNTCQYGLKQSYYFPKLSNQDDGNEVTFKTFWRQHSIDIDIETYDMLTINTSTNIKNIMEGFKDFKNIFKIIVITNPESDVESEKYFNSIGYEIDSYTNHVLYVKK